MTPDPALLLSAATPYAGAFLVGLFGGVHCAGMCGGIAGALTLGLPPRHRARVGGLLPWLLAFNAGRITTYVLLGAAFGAAGALAGDALAAWRGWVWLRLLAAAVMLALGLYLGGWWSGGNRAMERAGLVLWRRLSPLTRRLLPVDSPLKAIVSGMVWGLLPCGLIYYSLLWALASGGAVQGAGFMLAFGAGTLPTLLTIGLSAQLFVRGLQRRGVRRVGGLLLIGLALWTATAALLHQPTTGLGCVAS